MDAIIVGVSVSWTYITVAEYVNAQEGLGQLISNARRLSAMDQVFAGIIVIIAVALACAGAWFLTGSLDVPTGIVPTLSPVVAALATVAIG